MVSITISELLLLFLQVKEVIRNPHDGNEVKNLTDSLVSREEEERHQKMLGENEQLKRQISEVKRFLSDKEIHLLISTFEI